MKIIHVILTVLLVSPVINLYGQSNQIVQRPRLIAVTDVERGDQCRLLQVLMYANAWDIEGIVLSSSRQRWQGHNWPGTDWIEPYLDAYERTYATLLQGDPSYPSPDYIRSRVFVGNIDSAGAMEHNTAGSNFIAEVLTDTTDQRPIELQVWGGPNTIARALHSILEQKTEMAGYVAKKAKLRLHWDHDSTFDRYILPQWVAKYGLDVVIDAD